MNLGLVNPNDPHAVRRAFQSLQRALGFGSTPTFVGLTLTGLTATRLMQTNASKGAASVTNLANWIAGTANEINVADDGDGTVTIGIVDPLIVGKGGTGAATLADHGLLLGSGTDAVTPLGVATNGQLPIGSTGVDPVLATLTGTTNQITVTNGAGSIVLSFPSAVVIGHTDTDSAILRLNNAVDVSRLTFDVEGLAGAGHQSWAFQTDRNVNGDFTLLRGTVGAVPGTLVLHSDANGNIGIGKYSPGTLLDVNGVITATGGTSTNWNTAYGWGNHASAGYLTSPVAIVNGGSGQTTQQTAINALTAVAGATNEHVLTKDTVSGNAVWKTAAAGYTDEMAQDAVGVMLANTATITLTYTDATPELKADLDSTLKSNYDAAFTHKSNNGTDHSYINQSVKTTDSPSFIGSLFLDAELNQPVTAYGTATSYGKIEPDSASDGGLRLWGFSDAAGQRAIGLFGIIGVADPTDTTPAIDLIGGKSDGGTNVAVLGNAETLFQVENWGTAKFKMLGDGSVTIGDINSLNSSLNLRTGGNNRLVINSAGIISYPVQSGAGASKTAAQTVSTATWTKVQFETENYDYQGEYDPTTNYRFTATVAGLYLVSALVNINEVLDGKLVYVGLKRNGSFIAISPPAHSSTTAAGGQFFTLVVPLAATEYLEIWVYHTVGADRNVAGNGESFVSYAKIA